MSLDFLFPTGIPHLFRGKWEFLAKQLIAAEPVANERARAVPCLSAARAD